MRAILGFVGDDRGSMTIEFVLWIPVITAMLLIVVDASTLYLTHTEMAAVARDTARRMTTGQINSKRQAEEFAATAMSLRDYPYTVDAIYDPFGSMEVNIRLRSADMPIVGYSTLTLIGGTMTAHVAMRSAPVLASAAGSLISASAMSSSEPTSSIVVASNTGNGNGNGSTASSGTTAGNGNGNGNGSTASTGTTTGNGNGNGNGNGSTAGTGTTASNGNGNQTTTGSGTTNSNGNGNGIGNGKGNGNKS